MSGFRIITRPEWGAQERDGFGNRAIGNLELWLHHSVTVAPDLVPPYTDDYAAMRTLERIGQQRFGGGVPYTYGVTPAGLVLQGHSIGRIGAHTAGHNTKGVGIALVGNYETATPTPQQLQAVANLIAYGRDKGFWKRSSLSGGHRDTKATACPGKNAYGLIGTINSLVPGSGAVVPLPPQGPALLDVDGALGAASISRLQKAHGTKADGFISRPDSGLVRAVQTMLRGKGVIGYNGKLIVVDGAGLYSNIGATTPRTNTIHGLQVYLRSLGYFKGTVDGKLSKDDSLGVRALQKALNDGRYGI